MTPNCEKMGSGLLWLFANGQKSHIPVLPQLAQLPARKAPDCRGAVGHEKRGALAVGANVLDSIKVLGAEAGRGVRHVETGMERQEAVSGAVSGTPTSAPVLPHKT